MRSYLALWSAFVFSWFCVAIGEVVPFIEPGFFFDYNIPGQSPPIPITQQCETIHLTWGRQGAIGANPVGPWSFVVYTSITTVPYTIFVGSPSDFKFDWPVPFAPGTQYMICMYDSNGLPGGCQDKYTVIPNATVANPSCPNVTAPAQMAIDGRVASGPISQFGFVDQCTDISIKPLNGTPPFTLTIAPPLHPPYNLTSNTMDPIVWTVSLSRAMPFFMSMQSSDGFLWAAGPMHAGGFGPTDCLAPGTISSKRAKEVAAGAGVGGLFGGAFLAAVIFLAVKYWRKKREHPLQVLRGRPRPTLNMNISKPTMSETSSTTAMPAAALMRNNSASSDSSSTVTPSQTSADPFSDPFSPSRSVPPVSASTRQFRSESLYTPSSNRTQYVVQHHDAAASIVYASTADIVDLPPTYGGIPRQPPSIQTTTTSSASTFDTPDEEGPPPLPEKMDRYLA